MTTNELRQAAYNNVPFACRVIGGSVGRRVILHECPGIDGIADHDDMGQAPDRYRLEAVITGDDWHARYLQLLMELRNPGPGELLHPEGFRLYVVLESDPDHSITSVGEAVVSMSFVVVPDNRPIVQVDPATAVATKTTTVLSRARASIVNGMSVIGERARVATAAIEQTTAAIQEVTDTVRLLAPPDEVLDTLAALRVMDGTTTALVNAPGDLADRWADVFESLADTNTLASLAEYFGSSAPSALAALDLALATGTLEDQTIARNALAQDLIVWQTCLAAMANSIASTTYAVYDDAQTAVDDLTARLIDCEGYVDTQLRLAIVDLRGSLVESVLVVAQTLPRLTAFTPAATTSTAEIAQLLYQDGDRAAEIAARNAVQHPGFVSSASALLVVS